MIMVTLDVMITTTARTRTGTPEHITAGTIGCTVIRTMAGMTASIMDRMQVAITTGTGVSTTIGTVRTVTKVTAHIETIETP